MQKKKPKKNPTVKIRLVKMVNYWVSSPVGEGEEKDVYYRHLYSILYWKNKKKLKTKIEKEEVKFSLFAKDIFKIQKSTKIS